MGFGIRHDNPGCLFQPMIKQPQLSVTERPSLLAISGGRDSVALLHWLISSGMSGLVLCHLNHGLRGRESGQDAAFVRRLARQYGLPCEISRVDVQAYAARQGMSLETAGRVVRYAYLGEMAVKHSAERIYLAHHADDQAETILANLCRGSGITGLSGMKEETELCHEGQCFILVRPLLEWRRSDIDHYIQKHGLDFREDSSNRTHGPRRNRLRHRVLPLLNQIYERDVAPIIARCGQQALRDDAALWQLAESLAETHIESDGSLIIDAELKSAHPAIVSRVLRWWLVEKMKIPNLGHAEIEHALAMLKPGGPAKINLPGAHYLRRKAKRLWLE